MKKVCVIISDNKTYASFSDYLKIAYGAEKNGFIVDNIQVFPFEKFEYARQNFDFIIVDIGFIGNTEKQNFFEQKQI